MRGRVRFLAANWRGGGIVRLALAAGADVRHAGRVEQRVDRVGENFLVSGGNRRGRSGTNVPKYLAPGAVAEPQSGARQL